MKKKKIVKKLKKLVQERDEYKEYYKAMRESERLGNTVGSNCEEWEEVDQRLDDIQFVLDVRRNKGYEMTSSIAGVEPKPVVGDKVAYPALGKREIKTLSDALDAAIAERNIFQYLVDQTLLQRNASDDKCYAFGFALESILDLQNKPGARFVRSCEIARKALDDSSVV